ncbi:MAG: hypothetical protein ACK5Q1_16085, partial [Limnobacter sp.]
MIRLSELKLPLDHPEEALPALIHSTLKIAPEEVKSFSIYKRSYDARKQKLLLVYIVDVELHSARLEAQLLAKFSTNSHIRPAPDMVYHLPVKLSEAPAIRPVV